MPSGAERINSSDAMRPTALKATTAVTSRPAEVIEIESGRLMGSFRLNMRPERADVTPKILLLKALLRCLVAVLEVLQLSTFLYEAMVKQ